jgi:hypothetical protein
MGQTLYNMNETIQTIKDLAILTDNSYLLNKINKLEKQIINKLKNK